uniref:G_PROTEIN_RECEP_F1_2 domain-containing protein n=1 Tax=Caenorhabditis tropicalis TaxID=1561998 RepID=A0A1I7TLK2_9PELO
MRRTVGWFLFFIILVASAITGHLLLWDDPLQMYSFACFVIPKQSVPRASRFYIVCTILTLFNLVITVFIMRRNKRLEYATRFKIGARFEKRQAIDSTGTICFLAISLFIFMLIYSVGLCILLNIRSMISPVVFNFLIAWCYTIPFIAVMLPLLIIYRVNLSRTKRVKTISGITGTKQTQDENFLEIKIA